jgi:hypothetical protein
MFRDGCVSTLLTAAILNLAINARNAMPNGETQFVAPQLMMEPANTDVTLA